MMHATTRMHGSTRILCVIWALAAAMLLPTVAHAQANTRPHLLILGGASHTQSGFPDERIQRFYIATAAKAAEQLSAELDKSKIRNSKFIVWSRYPSYQQEIGIQISACDCNMILQVSFEKVINDSPQQFLVTYQLLRLAPSHSPPQNGQTAMTTRHVYSREFKLPISNEFLANPDLSSLAAMVISDLLKLTDFQS